jgi:hypothetical protein
MQGRCDVGPAWRSITFVVQQIMGAFLCGWRWWRSDTFVSSNSLIPDYSLSCDPSRFVAVEISLQISWFVENSLPAFVDQPFCSITKSVCQIQRLFPGRFHIFCKAAGLPQLQGWCTYLLKIFDNRALSVTFDTWESEMCGIKKSLHLGTWSLLLRQTKMKGEHCLY